VQEAALAIVAISAHLDDAALSASASLSRAGATVLTVFAGMPPPEFGVSLWDKVTGAVSSAVRQAERLDEDAEVMKLLAARGCYLDVREAQFRPAGPEPSVGELAEQIAGHLSEAGEVWLPAAIGKHRDHIIARDAGLRAARLAGHRSVVLYADFPYVISYGWPTWITGQAADPYLDAEHWLAHELAAAGLAAPVRTAEVIRLSQAQRELKVKIISAYRTQASALALRPEDLAARPGKLDYELFWQMSL
jgi:LmbE family N-acetylglucosaminyl deacetylase